MNGAAGGVLRRLGGRDLLSLALVAVVVATVVLGVAPLIFRSDTSLFLSAVLFGLAVGWITGRVPLPPAAAGLVDAALGIDFLLLAVGRLDVALRGWIGSVLRFLAGLLPQVPAGEVGSMGAYAYSLFSGSVSVIARFARWAVSITRGEDFFDPVASAFFWCLLFFLIGALAGWILSAGRKPLAAVFPAVLLEAAVVSYVRGDWRLAVLTVALVFLTVVIVEQNQKEQDWDRRDLGYSTSVRWDLTFSAAPVLGALLLAAYVFPSISVDDIRQWIQEQSRPQQAAESSVGQSFGLIPPASGQGEESQADLFPRSHYLGGGPDLTQDVVLVITTGEAMRYLPGIREPVAPHHYWRALTYDIYTGSGWITSPTEERELQPGERLSETLPQGTLLHQAVTVSRSGFGPVYYAGELASVYQLFRIVSRTDFDLMGVLVPVAQYEVDSVFLEAEESALRSAGNEYPEWIRSRYLQLPKILPKRVHALARDLTATPPTPYDRAVAIQEYLRSHMHYSLDIGSPPYEMDVVDYFLFGSGEGFCDYFATAMVVLARSAGIPARIVFGYASGTFDPAEGRYTVRESDAHTWPELYFPGIGWVEFEPTSVMPQIPRAPNSETILPGQLPPASSGGESPLLGTWILPLLQRAARPVLFALLAVPLLVLVWYLSAPIRIRLLPPAPLLRWVFRSLIAHGIRQGVRLSPGTTPLEFTRDLARLNPVCAAPLSRMEEICSRQAYSGRGIGAGDRKEILRHWPGLNRRLWWAWWKGRIARYGRRA